MSKYTFKVGDRVKIRQWEDMESEYGVSKYGNIKTPESVIIFSKNMKHLCGKIATITWIDSYGECSLEKFEDTFDEECTNFYFHTFMLEPIELFKPVIPMSQLSLKTQLPLETLIKTYDIIKSFVWQSDDLSGDDEFIDMAEEVRLQLLDYICQFRAQYDCKHCKSFLYKIDTNKYYCPTCKSYFNKSEVL